MPLVFVISGLFAALAGVLFALNYRQVHPFMGEALGLKGISAMVVGGMGNIWGAIAGGLIIGLAEAFSIRFFGADFVDISVYGLLLLILMVRPTGLFGGAQRGSARMSGYLEGIAVLLAINIVYAYAAFLPIAAGQLNLGVAGFAAIGGYSSAYHQQRSEAVAAARHSDGRACRRHGRAGGRDPGAAHPRHLSCACDLRAGRDRSGDDSQSRGGRRRGRISGHGLHPAAGRRVLRGSA